MSNRAVVKKSPQTPTTGAVQVQSQTSGFLSFYTDDSPGLKVYVLHYKFSKIFKSNFFSGPTTVLFMTLSFIGAVIVLHIWGKFNR